MGSDWSLNCLLRSRYRILCLRCRSLFVRVLFTRNASLRFIAVLCSLSHRGIIRNLKGYFEPFCESQHCVSPEIALIYGLEGVQFLRRFLFHVLPKGFHKVRYYGLWHPCKRDRQARARLLLELTTMPVAHSPAVLIGDIADEALGQSDLQSCGQVVKCPKCGSMNVHRIDTIRRRNPMVAK